MLYFESQFTFPFFYKSTTQCAKSPKNIRHSKYSTMLSKIHSYKDCFFSDFAQGKIKEELLRKSYVNLINSFSNGKADFDLS